MAEEVVVQQETSYADALKSSLNANYTAAAAPIETPVVQTPSEPAPPADPAEPVAPATPAFDAIAWFRENGIDDIDSVDTLKSKLNTPAPEPIVKQPEFSSEESKKIYENLVAGNKKEVREYLQKIELAETISQKPAADIIKAGWKEEYGLTDAQVERRFNKTYGIPDSELMDPEDKEIEQKLIDKQIEKEADKYKEYFGKYSTELSLPSLQQQAAPASAPPPESEEAKQAATFAVELSKSLPTDISKIYYEYKDETSGLTVAGKVEIPAKDISEIESKFGGHEDKLLAAIWFNEDGSPKSKNLIAQHIALITNPGKYINAAVSDAVTKTRIELLKESRNHQAPGATVITGDFEPSEDEKKRAFYRKTFM